MDKALAPGTRLGTGGMGRVYRARDPRLARNVAIKTLSGSGADNPESIRRFETEAGREGGVSYEIQGDARRQIASVHLAPRAEQSVRSGWVRVTAAPTDRGDQVLEQ